MWVVGARVVWQMTGIALPARAKEAGPLAAIQFKSAVLSPEFGADRAIRRAGLVRAGTVKITAAVRERPARAAVGHATLTTRGARAPTAIGVAATGPAGILTRRGTFAHLVAVGEVRRD